MAFVVRWLWWLLISPTGHCAAELIGWAAEKGFEAILRLFRRKRS
jgi:hypothetical protein